MWSDKASSGKKKIEFSGLYGRGKRFFKAVVLRDPFSLEVRRWFRDEGDSTLRLDYDLNKDSVVFDLGGYVGDFADQIHSRYGATVYLFEPSKDFFEVCQSRFEGNDRIKCFNFGLSDADGEFELSDGADASSISRPKVGVHAKGELVHVRQFAGFMDELGSSPIDLLKINIEGGEYDVLPHLIKEGVISRVRNLQVQFHTFIDDAERKRSEIREALAETHKNDWCYEFVWENWSLKQPNGRHDQA